jgi:hypothetical protein
LSILVRFPQTALGRYEIDVSLKHIIGGKDNVSRLNFFHGYTALDSVRIEHSSITNHFDSIGIRVRANLFPPLVENMTWAHDQSGPNWTNTRLLVQ